MKRRFELGESVHQRLRDILATKLPEPTERIGSLPESRVRSGGHENRRVLGDGAGDGERWP